METINLNATQISNQSINLAKGYLKELKNLSTTMKNKPLGSALLNLFDHMSNFNKKNKEFVLNFFKQYESIYADVASSFENPDCSCRKRFSEYMENNPDTSENLFLNLLASLDQVEIEEVIGILRKHVDHFNTLNNKVADKKPNGEIEKETVAKDKEYSTAVRLAGKSFIIGNKAEDYSLFFANLVKNNAQYKGLSIAQYDENNIMVVFY